MDGIAKITDIFVLIAVTIVSSIILCGTLHERVSTVLVQKHLAVLLEGVSDRGYITEEDFDKLQNSLYALHEDWRLEEFSLNRMMYEPEYAMSEEIQEENKYVYKTVKTEFPEIIDEPPFFSYKAEYEAEEYNDALRSRKHVCSICEDGGLCEYIRDFRPLRDTEKVIKGSPLPKCAIILYSDGSEKAVACTIDTDSEECCENKPVTLQYEAGGKMLTCTYSLNVLSDIESCTKGHTYYRKSALVERECPYCAEYPEYIEACVPCEPLDIKMGNSLVSSGVTVEVFYMDGHKEILYSGYADNFDENYVGIQTVTISYRGRSDVIVINNIAKEYICASCNSESNYQRGYETGLCKECILKVPHFTGSVWSYEKIFYKNDIIEKLYSEGIFYLKKGDFLKMEISIGKTGVIVYGTEIRGGAD